MCYQRIIFLQKKKRDRKGNLIMKIFIDAGHNDKLCDTGATANGLKEQDITFAVSNILAEKFKNIDVDIKLSRPTKSTILGTDLNSSLNKRAELANKWGADLFLSIHCNSFWLASANGTEVYAYSKKSSVYNLGKKIAENISKQLDINNRKLNFLCQCAEITGNKDRGSIWAKC